MILVNDTLFFFFDRFYAGNFDPLAVADNFVCLFVVVVIGGGGGDFNEQSGRLTTTDWNHIDIGSGLCFSH